MTRAPAHHLVVRFDGGPWHHTEWTPANPAGVHSTLRVHGWSGSYRRHHLDRIGRWVFRWMPDFTVPP